MTSYRIRPDFLARLQAAGVPWPKATNFRRYFRERALVGQPERHWKNLKSGKAVPAVIAAAFADYLRDRRQIAWATLEEVFEVEPEKGAWGSPEEMERHIKRRFTDRQAMYMLNAYDDYMTAAEMVIHSAGTKMAEPGEPLDKESCLRRGGLKMGRSLVDYAGWLLEITQGERLFRTVMFYLVGKQRIGVTVLLPLKERPFRLLCAGQLRDDEIVADDLQAPGRYLFMEAMSDGTGMPKVNALKKTLAQRHGFFYQMSYLTRHIDPFRPVIAALAANDHYLDLLKAQGFTPNGHYLKGTSYPIMILSHPEEPDQPRSDHPSAYRTYIRIMRFYRFFNWRQWAREDRLNRENRRQA